MDDDSVWLYSLFYLTYGSVLISYNTD